MTLESGGNATPSVRSIKVTYPRNSYLELLPRVYRRDPAGALFLEQFLALFERVLTGVEDDYERFSRQLNPDAAPIDVINWLACLVDLSFDPSWPLARRRALVAAAMDLYKRRGTVAGIERYVEIYTGVRPVVVESFLARPRQPAYVGRAGSILGCTLSLSPVAADAGPDEALVRGYAHRFTVLVFPVDECDGETLLPVVDRIVTVNKPAHTVHEVRAVFPEARIGLQNTVGVDFVLGGRTAPRVSLGPGCGPARGRGRDGRCGRRGRPGRRHGAGRPAVAVRAPAGPGALNL